MKPALVILLRSIPPIRRAFAVLSIGLSLVIAFAALGNPVNTSWTYQGQLRRNGAAYNGTCNFQFSLWDAASAGTQQGNTLSSNSVSVVNGLFTVTLDFGIQNTAFFTGDARWLGTTVQCSGDGGFTPLDPRQPITAAPYALSLRPGAAISGPGATSADALGTLNVVNTQGGVGLLGKGGIGLLGSASQQGYGVWGESSGGPDSAGVFGVNTSGPGIWGRSLGNGPAVYGEAISTGYAGQFIGPVRLEGPVQVIGALTGFGLGDGINGTGSTGVHGVSNGNTGTIGVMGEATGTNSSGVYGVASGTNTAGVLGRNSSGPAVWAQGTGAGAAIYGQATSNGLAGRFTGPVQVEGNLVVQGTLVKSAGTFRIDHPLDPEHKFLSHSFIESPDMMNIYNGNVTTDATGNATVTLPAYFAALNRDYRYQLTVIGQFAQAIVSRKIIAENTFAIQTDKPGVEVSWMVTGVRQDAYAKENPIVVEEAKSPEEEGKYLYPAGFGAGEEKRIGHSNGPEHEPGAPGRSWAGQSDPTSK